MTDRLEEALAPVTPFERMKPVSEDGIEAAMEWEDAPLRTVNLEERVAANRPQAESCRMGSGDPARGCI